MKKLPQIKFVYLTDAEFDQLGIIGWRKTTQITNDFTIIQ